MNIHLPAILMFTRGTSFDTLPYGKMWENVVEYHGITLLFYFHEYTHQAYIKSYGCVLFFLGVPRYLIHGLDDHDIMT